MSEIIKAVVKSTVDRSLSSDWPEWHGVITGSKVRKELDVIDRFIGFYARDKIEYDPNYIQVIPLAIVTWDGKIAVTIRSSGGEYKESRLRGKMSIAVGGHWRYGETIDGCLKRELLEELNVSLHYHKTLSSILGLIYLGGLSLVNRVHIGIVHSVNVVDKPVLNDNENSELIFMSEDDMIDFVADGGLNETEDYFRALLPVIARKIGWNRLIGEDDIKRMAIKAVCLNCGNHYQYSADDPVYKKDFCSKKCSEDYHRYIEGIKIGEPSL